MSSCAVAGNPCWDGSTSHQVLRVVAYCASSDLPCMCHKIGETGSSLKPTHCDVTTGNHPNHFLSGFRAHALNSHTDQTGQGLGGQPGVKGSGAGYDGSGGAVGIGTSSVIFGSKTRVPGSCPLGPHGVPILKGGKTPSCQIGLYSTTLYRVPPIVWPNAGAGHLHVWAPNYGWGRPQLAGWDFRGLAGKQHRKEKLNARNKPLLNDYNAPKALGQQIAT